MANPERGEVDLVTPTKTYTLFLSTNALCAMQQRTGKTFGQLMAGIFQLDMVALRALTHAVLQRYHAKEFPNEESVGPLIDSVKYKAISDTLAALFTLNTPPAEEKKPSGSANPPQSEDEADGIGDSSTLTLVASG